MTRLWEIVLFVLLAMFLLAHTAMAQPCDSLEIRRGKSITQIPNLCYDLLSKAIVPEYNRLHQKEQVCDSLIASYQREIEAKNSIIQLHQAKGDSCTNSINALVVTIDSLSYKCRVENAEKQKLQGALTMEKYKSKTNFYLGALVGFTAEAVLTVFILLVAK